MIELPVVQPGPVYAPVTNLMLYLEEDCNLRCTYCFVQKKPRRMQLETARKTVEWFLSRNVSGAEPTVCLNFFGGEPFLAVELRRRMLNLKKFNKLEDAKSARARVAAAITVNLDEDGKFVSVSEEVRATIASYHPETGELVPTESEYYTDETLAEMEADLLAQLAAVRSIRQQAAPLIVEALESSQLSEVRAVAEQRRRRG